MILDLIVEEMYIEDELWIVNTKLNNFFKGVFTILNWGQIT